MGGGGYRKGGNEGADRHDGGNIRWDGLQGGGGSVRAVGERTWAGVRTLWGGRGGISARAESQAATQSSAVKDPKKKNFELKRSPFVRRGGVQRLTIDQVHTQIP
jgi:hypothetical protein